MGKYMTDKILLFYEEYKSFMKLQGGLLPSIKFIMEQDNELGALAHVNTDEINSKNASLYCCERLFDCSEKFQKAKLFHEFTHIFDYMNNYQLYNSEELDAILSTYSEYHASQIELAINVGFRDVFTFYKINLDRTYVDSENEKITIQEDYLRPMATASCVIDKSSDSYVSLPCEEYYSLYKKFQINTMYYLGKQNLCAEISFKRIPNITQKVYGDFYQCIANIEACIKNRRFEKLINLDKQLFGEFLERYPNNEFKILTKEFPGRYV